MKFIMIYKIIYLIIIIIIKHSKKNIFNNKIQFGHKSQEKNQIMA